MKLGTCGLVSTLAAALSIQILASAPAHAQQPQIQHGEVRLQVQRIQVNANRPIRVQVMSLVRGDGCNKIGLGGGFRRIELVRGSTSLKQEFLADFAVVSTLMACVPAPKAPAVETLNSSIFEVQPMYGQIDVTFYLPVGLTLTLLDGPSL
jgi:hypothetical protein